MDNFFPSEDYKVPVTSNYMKLVEGSNKFRVLSSAIVGYEYFKDDNKPVRSREPFEETPGIKKNGKVSHFWAFLVWNYDAKRVQILELSQKSIQNQFQAYIKNPDWGHPKEYDVTINRKGTSMMDTEYTVMPSPHKPIDPEIQKQADHIKVDLTALYEGLDPFTVDKN
jgi:hypothetical protein